MVRNTPSVFSANVVSQQTAAQTNIPPATPPGARDAKVGNLLRLCDKYGAKGGNATELKTKALKKGTCVDEELVTILQELVVETNKFRPANRGGEEAALQMLLEKAALDTLMSVAKRAVADVDVASSLQPHFEQRAMLLYTIDDLLMLWLSYDKVKNPDKVANPDGRLVDSYVKKVNSVEQLVTSNATAQTVRDFSAAVIESIVTADLPQVFTAYYQKTNTERPGYRQEKIDYIVAKFADASVARSDAQKSGYFLAKLDRMIGLMSIVSAKSMSNLDLTDGHHKTLFRNGGDFALVCFPLFDSNYSQSLLCRKGKNIAHQYCGTLFNDLYNTIADMNVVSDMGNQFDAEMKKMAEMLALYYGHTANFL